MDPREEEELRRLIRRELEFREKQRDERREDEQLRRSSGFSDDRRRIIDDEVEAYYRAKGGYRKVVNDDGDVEWLTDTELREREGQIPVDMEELEVGQRRVRNRLIAAVFLSALALLLLFIIFRERTGTIQVICNIPGATVQLNGSATDYTTNAEMRHVPVGPHLISVYKYGYKAEGVANQRVTLRANRTEIAVFKLIPTEPDSLGRSK